MNLKRPIKIVVIVLIAALTIFSIGISIYMFPSRYNYTIPNRLVVAVSNGPSTIDPQDALDSASANVLDNCLEGLYAYNLSDPNLPIIPRLASAMGTWSGDNYTVPLRQDVTFQDGSVFTSADVVWSFNRLMNLMSLGKATAAELYKVYVPSINDTINIINRVVANGPYSVTFVLNTTYGPFVPLLCFEGSMIMKADSEPVDNNIDLLTGSLVGTGPWIYKSYETGVQVTFDAYKNYWRGAPHFNQLIFDVIPDSNARDIVMLAGDTDIYLTPSQSLLSTYNTTSGLVLKRVGSNLATSYLGMNNKLIPVNIRKAISYALDYSSILTDVFKGSGYRMNSPIPKGITFSNYSFNVATYNITIARQAMQSEFPSTAPSDVQDDNSWKNITLATYNYTYPKGDSIREKIYNILFDNLGAVGIKVEKASTSWTNYENMLLELDGKSRNDLGLFWMDWSPTNYLGTYDYLNPLITNRTLASNYAQVNDSQVQSWMEQAVKETNSTIQQVLYNKIQKRLVEEVYPWAFGFTGVNYDVWKSDIHGFSSNAMDKAYFYPCYRS
ncbi:MAG: ABC transporter substrate-binding protein [Candidatus Lokiarchaeota archaeon]